jgi:NAD+ kinase
MNVALFGSPFTLEKSGQILNVFTALKRIDARIFVCRSFYDYICSVLPTIRDLCSVWEDQPLDVAISIGGDGTFLRTAHRVGTLNVPIIGINTGRLGFLADVESIDVDQLIQDLYKRNYRIEQLQQLALFVDGERFQPYPSALNEVAVLKRDTSSMIHIRVSVDGDYLNDYQADGLIVATPTGSTAYALSVGGPILMPATHNWVIAAVAAHNLNVRPIIVPDTSILDLELESRSQNFLISLDGNSFTLPCTAKLQVKPDNTPILAIRQHGHTFSETLRKKLKWGMDPRRANG